MPKIFEPWTTFRICWLQWIVIIVEKFKEMMTFFIWCLKRHFSSWKNIIILAFLVKVLWWLVRITENKTCFFCFLINGFMEIPFAMTEILLEFNQTAMTFDKEFSKFIWNYCYINLIWMWWKVKIFLHNMNEVCNNNNFIDIVQISGLIDTISDSK